MHSKGTQPYIHVYPFSPKLRSHPGCHVILSGFPGLYRRSVLVIQFKYGGVCMSIPNSLIPLSRLSLWRP